MRKFMFALIWLIAISGQLAAVGPKLKVHPNKHSITDLNGNPVMLAGDTFWNVGIVLTRAQINEYLDKRKAQGFNTVTAIGFGFWNGNPEVNVYGDKAFKVVNGKFDPTQRITTPGSDPSDSTQYDYWDHLEYFIQQVDARGMYVCFSPVWGRYISGAWGGRAKNDIIFDANSAYDYGHWLGKRFRNYDHIIWVMGGDRWPINGGVDYKDVYRYHAEGVADGGNDVYNKNGSADWSTTLMMYHTRKTDIGSDNDPNNFTGTTYWWPDEPWMDIHSMQDYAEQTARNLVHDFDFSPTKPSWLYEGSYEEPSQGRDSWVSRIQMYQPIFSGGFGFIFGNEQLCIKREDNLNALYAPAAESVKHIVNLMNFLSGSQHLSLQPAQDIIGCHIGTSPSWGTTTEIYTRITATTTSDKNLALIYVCNGRNITIKMSGLTGPKVSGFWYNPGNGKWNTGSSELTTKTPFQQSIVAGSDAVNKIFDPPGGTGRDCDWVLLLETEKKEEK